jgi:hypothetical protein
MFVSADSAYSGVVTALQIASMIVLSTVATGALIASALRRRKSRIAEPLRLWSGFLMRGFVGLLIGAVAVAFLRHGGTLAVSLGLLFSIAALGQLLLSGFFAWGAYHASSRPSS